MTYKVVPFSASMQKKRRGRRGDSSNEKRRFEPLLDVPRRRVVDDGCE